MAEPYKYPDDAKHDDLDRALDSALAKYAAVEPRAGLEDRVLANLRAERAQAPDRAWWRWSVAAALAAVVIVAVALAWRSGQPLHPTVANHSSPAFPTSKEPTTQFASNAAGGTAPPQVRRSLPGIVHHRRATVVAAAGPKLDQFPSPRPLSEQELALARYVSEFPQEARLIARAQEEYEKETQREMKDERSETEGHGSDQQER